ncbi:MAG TPA: glycoside hydrolase family 18 protein [Bacillota bacterium]
MQIHVVKEGETITTIANAFGTTVNALIDANELDAPNELVIGQALVIPIIGQFYFVQPGDSLYSIAQRFGLSYEELARINNISINQTLPVGFRLYIPQREKRPIVSNAYIEPLGESVSPALINAATKHSPDLTYLSIMSYRVNRDGTLNRPPLDQLPNIAQSANASLVLVVTNLEEDQFSSELAHIVLTVQNARNTLLDQIINIAYEIGYKDVHFDFEFIYPTDREAYNSFLRMAKDRLSQAGLTMSTALAPKTSAAQTGILYEAHDYETHGELADFVILMTYEWGYGGGPPMAVSPINEVRKVVQYALTEIPADKILLGQNLYGYDWTLPYEPGGEFAPALSPQQAIALARENRVAIEYDTTAQAPFFHYTDEAGNQHEVWFEDARSIQAKFNLIKEFDLLGISYWKLGLAFPQNWLLLTDQFNVTKLT